MRRLLSLSVLGAFAAGSLSCSNPANLGPYELVWADEFNAAAGTLPDPTNWGYDIGTDWGNAQLEWTTDCAENVSHDGNGHLVITARRESFNGQDYTSARITTAGKRQFRYGRIEARIKQPIGQGLWPAFWLLGANIGTVGWPQSGEIDVMEFRGQEPLISHGSLHGPGYSGGNAITRRYVSPGVGLHEEFHVYRVDWSPGEIRFFVDDSLYHLVKKGDQRGEWVFDHEFYLILNIAVGGGFVGPVGGDTQFPQQMLVDWVRVYQRAR